VRTWVSKLYCLRLSELVIFMYLFEGNEGSMHFVLVNLGDRFHHISISFWCSL